MKNKYSLIEKLSLALDNVDLKKLSWTERREYFLERERIERLLTLDFYLINRDRIVKLIKYKYPFETKDIILRRAKLNIGYDQYGYLEHPEFCINIYVEDVIIHIKDEIERVFKEIEKHNYKLNLEV